MNFLECKKQQKFKSQKFKNCKIGIFEKKKIMLRVEILVRELMLVKKRSEDNSECGKHDLKVSLIFF